MLSSLATRTSVQSFSISSIVRIMTMLCQSSGDSKCLPNLREGKRAGIRKDADTSLCRDFHSLSSTRAWRMQRSPGEGLVHAPQSWYLLALVFQGLCGTGLEWGRAQVRFSKDPGTLRSPEAFPKPMSLLYGLCDLVIAPLLRATYCCKRTLHTYPPVNV